MRKILVFGGSSSKNSINKKFAHYTALQIPNITIDLLDLNDYEMPLFSVDHEAEFGIPDSVSTFLERIKAADGVIISLAEHNGAYTAAFKNILDWSSRARENIDVWQGKSMFLLSTSPGGRGGASVHALATGFFPHMAANITASFKLPKYYENFSPEEGIRDITLLQEYLEAVKQFQNSLGLK